VDISQQNGTTYVRVVDYKSSGKKFDLSEVLYGLNMQMLIYLFAIWKNGFRDYENITPAGILYMPVNAPFVGTERDEDEGEIEKKKLKNAKMNGMVLDDSRVVYLMDNSGQGVLIPASIKKDGVCSGTLISLKQMDLLMKRCEKILAQMAVDLHNGIIHINPAHSESGQSPYNDVCKFCDYKEVCLADEDTPIRKIENIKHSDVLTKLGGECDA
jgi:ATP-dependent helicase/nuclease subunit B